MFEGSASEALMRNGQETVQLSSMSAGVDSVGFDKVQAGFIRTRPVDGEWTTVSWIRLGSGVGNLGSFCVTQID